MDSKHNTTALCFNLSYNSVPYCREKKNLDNDS